MKLENVKLSPNEVKYIQVLRAIGVPPIDISTLFGYKYKDVINVLRGNTYSSITGILNRTITETEVIVAEWFLKQDMPYREVAAITRIDANKVRNIKGVMQYRGVL